MAKWSLASKSLRNTALYSIVLHSTLNGRQAEKVLCPQGNTTLQRHAEGEGEGDGLLCMSLPQSALHCSSHLISAPCTEFTTYIFCTITLLFALSKHTHTHKHKITILHYPSSQAQEHYIFFCTLHTSSTRSLFTFHFSLSSCQNHCTLHNRVRPFHVPGNTLCSPYVYVYVIYVCMSVRCISV